MRADGCTGMAEPCGGWDTNVLSFLPTHSVGAPDHEVVTTAIFWLMLLFMPRGFGPTTEHNDVRATDVHCVVESVLRWAATHSES